MGERFVRIFKWDSNELGHGSISIEAGALLLDTETGKVLVQLKLKNNIGKKIRSCVVKITVFDENGSVIETVKYDYNENVVEPGEPFGTQVPVWVNKAAKKFDAEVVAFIAEEPQEAVTEKKVIEDAVAAAPEESVDGKMSVAAAVAIEACDAEDVTEEAAKVEPSAEAEPVAETVVEKVATEEKIAEATVVKSKTETVSFEVENKKDVAPAMPETAATETKKKKGKAWIWIIVAVVVAALAVVVFAIILPGQRKKQDIPQPKEPVASIPEETETTEENNPEVVINIGDYVQFGEYGGEPIYWKVLDKESDKALIISFNAVEAKAFSIDSNSWTDSTLRTWLNEIFVNDAFSSENTDLIEKTKIASDNNSGKSSEDLVFILSATEAEKYFSSDADRRAVGSDYAEADGLLVSKTGYCRWWLRTPGAAANMMSVINGDGVIDTYGSSVTENSYGVRPAMWVQTSGLAVVDSDTMEDIIAAAEMKASDAAAQASTGGKMYSKVDELMVRTGPGQNYNAVAKLYVGDGVTLIEIVDGWAHIMYGGGDFWVSAQYLTEIPDACFEAIMNCPEGIEAINNGWGWTPTYRGEDNEYFFFQVYCGGGWQCLKVQRTSPYAIQKMNASEEALYCKNPYQNLW